MSFLDTQELQVGLTNQASFTKIRMKQYDKNTRQINIYLLDSDNQIVELPSTYIAKFQATKPDGKIVFDSCTIDGDKIVYIPNEQLTTTVGEVKCEIGLYKPDVNNSDQLIQSTTFNIQVMESVMNRDGVVSSDSYNALTVLINTVTGVITEAEQAVEAADIAIDNANKATTNANNAATLATNVSERLENETLRIFKPAVNAYAELSTTYPNPEIGWTVTVNELLATYRYNGVEWVNLGSIDCIGNATDTSLGVVKGGGNVDIATDGTLSVPLIQTDTINDTTKIPSSAVTHALGQEIDTLNNNLASLSFPVPTHFTGITTQEELDNALNDLSIFPADSIYVHKLWAPSGVNLQGGMNIIIGYKYAAAQRGWQIAISYATNNIKFRYRSGDVWNEWVNK